MVWNEPGKDKDPWNSKERPPDLERIVKNLHKRFGWLFGGKRGGPQRFNIAILWWLLPVITATWLLSGFYKVAPGERGVHFVFGRYTQVVSSGLHWHMPWPIGHADIISGVEGRDYTRSYNRLITSDGNVVTIDAVAQYHVVDISDYLFNTAVAAGTAESADAGTRALLGILADAAIRTAVAHSTLDNVMGSGQDTVEEDASQRLNALLKQYATGIAVTRLSFQHVSLPESVSSSDADISAAQQDAGQAKTAAQEYADTLLPQVKSEADAKIAEAGLYRTTLMDQAQADITGFDAVLTAYRKAPAVTRDMLYTQTMEEILSNANKVVVDTRSGNVTVQLNQAPQPAKSGMDKKPAPAKNPTSNVSAASAASSHQRQL
ncbi:MAG: FtsH protease activity modulator HflK [Gammaproteobacteria bacterium]